LYALIAPQEKLMPKGPRGERRPADVVSAAVMVGRIATGEERETPPPPLKNAHAVALGKLGGEKGGKARAKNMSAKQLKEQGKKAALARWSKKRGA
jgi:hypothetical protein